MKCSDSHLFTPVYLKLNEAMAWPEQEKAFYLLTSDGLFLCRNTPFFRSCVPVDRFPSELAGHTPFLQLNYPRIPRPVIEQVVGFFDILGTSRASEAGVLIVWNRQSQLVEVVVPPQIGWVGTTWRGDSYPIELEYQIPQLPPHLVLLGDIHSHVDGPAYSSFTDKSDEIHRPGLHLVVGRIFDEPPEFHCEAVADGCRFKVKDLSLVLQGYHRRRVNEVPLEWIQMVSVQSWHNRFHSGTTAESTAGHGSGTPGNGSGFSNPGPARRTENLEAEALPPAPATPDSSPASKAVSPQASGAKEAEGTAPASKKPAHRPPL